MKIKFKYPKILTDECFSTVRDVINNKKTVTFCDTVNLLCICFSSHTVSSCARCRVVSKIVMGISAVSLLAACCRQIFSNSWLMGFMVCVIPVELAPTRLNSSKRV